MKIILALLPEVPTHEACNGILEFSFLTTAQVFMLLRL
jgi:hypothetical protein